MSEQTLSFPETSDSSSFQMKETHTFSKHKHSSRHLKRKRTPEYRRISKYFKSTKQYWKERKRRKAAYDLHAKGLTYKQIAERLGLSAKTVSSDLKKTRRYHRGRINGMFQRIRAEREAEYTKHLEGLTLAEQDKRLKTLTKFYLKMHHTRQALRDTLDIKVNLDEVLDLLFKNQHFGRPRVTVFPKKIYTPLNRLRLRVMVNYHKQPVITSTHSYGDFK